jgi:hypothetical protein
MILNESYSSKWIAERRLAFGKSDPGIVEKVIFALSLVEQLRMLGLEFTFKGGTSLLVLLPEPKRFSIDVDIVTLESRFAVEAILKEVCKRGIFTRSQLEDERSYQPGIPKAHYRLYYSSVVSSAERFVLLDILFELHGYSAVFTKNIENAWVQTGPPYCNVQLPTVDSILGDKLTAFAPMTIGIPYRAVNAKGILVEKQMEVMKQLFDVGVLFDSMERLDHFQETFFNTAQKEIGYRSECELTPEMVLEDIINTGLYIASSGRFFDVKGDYPHVVQGLSQLKPFIYTGVFRKDDAVLASSKAAYLAAIALVNYTGETKRWSYSEEISSYKIDSLDYQFLNKLRHIPGGPLFYWYQTLLLLKKL